MKIFYHFGRYLKLLGSLFVRPENTGIYWREMMRQMVDIGVGSLGIVAIISLFLGAVTTVQTAYQLVSALIPLSTIGTVVSESTILELSPTITCLVLAGRVGSSIASTLGSMRISEQIDALEIMGVNSAAYLIGPRILAAMIVIPFLIIISASLSIYGGMMAGQMSGIVPSDQFVLGARESFRTYSLVLMLIKSVTFAYIITSVSAYQGFYVRGGDQEVGRATTRANVYCCVMILFADYMIAELLIR